MSFLTKLLTGSREAGSRETGSPGTVDRDQLGRGGALGTPSLTLDESPPSRDQESNAVVSGGGLSVPTMTTVRPGPRGSRRPARLPERRPVAPTARGAHPRGRGSGTAEVKGGESACVDSSATWPGARSPWSRFSGTRTSRSSPT